MALQSRPLTNAAQQTARQSCEAWALSRMPEEPVPMDMHPWISTTLDHARSRLEPASERERAVALAKLFDFAVAFGVPNPLGETAAATYGAALKTLPGDVLMDAIDGVIASHAYGMRLPLPSEISAQAADEMQRRRSVVAKLEIASRAPLSPRSGPAPTPEEIARVDAIMSQWRTERSRLERAREQSQPIKPMYVMDKPRAMMELISQDAHKTAQDAP